MSAARSKQDRDLIRFFRMILCDLRVKGFWHRKYIDANPENTATPAIHQSDRTRYPQAAPRAPAESSVRYQWGCPGTCTRWPPRGAALRDGPWVRRRWRPMRLQPVRP